MSVDFLVELHETSVDVYQQPRRSLVLSQQQGNNTSRAEKAPEAPRFKAARVRCCSQCLYWSAEAELHAWAYE